MPISTKILILAGFVLLAIITGYATGHLAHADGATVPAAIRAGAIGFGSTLTLLLALLTAYALL
ncbi:hypothetical protein ABZ511_03850 [Nocardia gamkensis]|uniref:hypothetical protein n=1 Tax=Nocardia gamkensis TaxID=352869 RepID=UPI0033C1A742